MKHHRRLFLVLVLLLLVGGLLLVPKLRWPIYGWLRGEAFYQGMPASWWAKEIRETYQSPPSNELVLYESRSGVRYGRTEWFAARRPPLWEEMQAFMPGATGTRMLVLNKAGRLLNGDPQALPLLSELVRSDSVKVRRVAIRGLAAQNKDRPEVVPALVEAAADDDEEVRQDAIAALRELDPEAAAKAGLK